LIDKGIISKPNPYNFIEYHKWRFNGEWYVPLGKPHGEDRNKQFVLKASAKYGFLGRFNPICRSLHLKGSRWVMQGLSNQFALLGYDIIAHRGYPVYDNSDPR
jgi:outer membrane protein insertion porin family